jgi:hypothetical protein
MADETGAGGEAPGKIELPFLISQLQQSQDAYRLVITLTSQFITVLVVANVTLIGYAISQRVAGILLVGPIFPAGIIVAVLVGRRSALPIAYTVVNLEYKYGRRAADWLGSTFVSIFVNAAYVDELLEVGRIADFHERMARLRKMRGPLVGSGRGIVRASMILVALVQAAAAIVLWLYFGWRMF